MRRGLLVAARTTVTVAVATALGVLLAWGAGAVALGAWSFVRRDL